MALNLRCRSGPTLSYSAARLDAGLSDFAARRVEDGGFLAHERLEGGRRTTEQPSQDVWIAEEVMAAVARFDGADHPQLMLKGAPVGIAHSRADEGLGV